jgi:hypothetical protein
LGQEKLILGKKVMNYGTEQGDFLGQEKLTYGHNKTNFGTEQGVFWDWRSCFIMGHNDVTLGDRRS